MFMFRRGSFSSHCFPRLSVSFDSVKELRLCVQNSTNFSNAFCIQSGFYNFKSHKISFIPDRKIMNSYFGLTVKKKIGDAFDSIRLLKGGNERLHGFLWYNTLEGINHKDFITLLELPDSFYSWFKITELHTWMILLNLPQRTRAQKTTRISLINAMWIDTENRSKIMAPLNKNSKKNFRSLYERFQVSLYLYDDAYFNNDRELSSAIWYNFYEKENIDPRLIEVLVSYIRYQETTVYKFFYEFFIMFVIWNKKKNDLCSKKAEFKLLHLWSILSHIHELLSVKIFTWLNHMNSLEISPEKIENENLQIWTSLRPHHEKVFNLY